MGSPCTSNFARRGVYGTPGRGDRERPRAIGVRWPSLGARLVYQKTRKVPDLFWNMYVCRPVAAVLVNLVKDTRITPNQITLAAVVVAVASAALLLVLPGYQGLVI